MKTLQVQVADDVAARIESAAKQKGISVEELVRASMEEALTRESEFERAARHVLEKNTELYRRLS
jgi:ribosome-binding protein aMBF1 (putative translation factor)